MRPSDCGWLLGRSDGRPLGGGRAGGSGLGGTEGVGDVVAEKLGGGLEHGVDVSVPRDVAAAREQHEARPGDAGGQIPPDLGVERTIAAPVEDERRDLHFRKER